MTFTENVDLRESKQSDASSDRQLILYALANSMAPNHPHLDAACNIVEGFSPDLALGNCYQGG